MLWLVIEARLNFRIIFAVHNHKITRIMSLNLAPIVLFVYNRPSHTKQTIEALQKNNLANDSELFIFCDGPRGEKDLAKLKEVHQIIDNVSGFKNVVVKKLSLNRGLANSVLAGVGEVINRYGKVIVLEDDIVTAANFLDFINQSLEFYKEDKRIFAITGFNYPNYKNPKNYSSDVFFVQGRMSSWGWGSWKDRWNQVDFAVKDFDEIKSNKGKQKEFRKCGDNFFEMLENQIRGKIDAWDIQISWTMFKKNMSCVVPVSTLVKNIGFDASGVHCHADPGMMNFDLGRVIKKVDQVKFDQVINNSDAEKNFLKYTKYSFVKKLISSRKKRIKLKYVIFGMVIVELLRFLFL